MKFITETARVLWFSSSRNVGAVRCTASGQVISFVASSLSNCSTLPKERDMVFIEYNTNTRIAISLTILRNAA